MASTTTEVLRLVDAPPARLGAGAPQPVLLLLFSNPRIARPLMQVREYRNMARGRPPNEPLAQGTKANHFLRNSLAHAIAVLIVSLLFRPPTVEPC